MTAEISGTVHHVNFSVSDLDASTQWYMAVFGLSVLRELPDPDGRWDRVILRHPRGLLVGLTAHRANTGQPAVETGCGVDHVAFTVPDASSLEDWRRHLDQLDVVHSEVKTTPLGQLVALRDPDNIQLEVYAPANS